MKIKNKDRLTEGKVLVNDKRGLIIKLMPNGDYDIVMNGWVAQRFRALNRQLAHKNGRKLSDEETLGIILDEIILEVENVFSMDFPSIKAERTFKKLD